MSKHDSIDWLALVEEFKHNEPLLSMKDFCALKKVSLKTMKYHYNQSLCKTIPIKSAHCSSKHSFIYLEYKQFRFKLFPGFDPAFLKSILQCIDYDS